MTTRKEIVDPLSELGVLALATRLRRLGEWLQRDATRTYGELDLPAQARWFPVLWTLREGKNLSITEIATRLRLTHPAVVQIANSMSRQGVLESRKDRTDKRRRLVRLSRKGKRLVLSLRPVWEIIRNEAETLLKTEAPAMSDSLRRLEKSLAHRNMYSRVRDRLKQEQLNRVEIIDFKSPHREIFKRLNREWLIEFFRVEPEDAKILDDPHQHIILPGGAIFMAKLDGRVVGTTALIRRSDAVFEIAKMAVTKSARGLQVGRKLALAALEKARMLGASRVILHTNPKLKPAMALYRSLGFTEIALAPPLRRPFIRPTTTMQFRLSSRKKPSANRKRRSHEK